MMYTRLPNNRENERMSSKGVHMIRLFVAAALLLAGFAPADAQELRYLPGKQVEYDNPDRHLSEGPVIFNGQEYGCFYTSRWVDDGDGNLYFRRLDRDGMPVGPQVRVSDRPGPDLGVAAVWDGEAYIVLFTMDEGEGAYLARVGTNGDLLAESELPGQHQFWIYDMKGSAGWANHRMDVVDGRLHIFFTSGSSPNNGTTWLARMPADLDGDIEMTALPAGGLKNAALLGLAFAPEGYLLLLGELGFSDSVVKKTRFLRVGYEGAVNGAPFEGPVDLDNCASVIGPVFTGNGYLICYTQYHASTLYNRSVVLDRNLTVLHGPNELGESTSPFTYLAAEWVGYAIHTLALSHRITAEGSLLFNDRGRFFVNPLWHKDSLYSVSTRPFLAFGGLSSEVVYLVYSATYKGHHFLSNQVTLPTSVKKPVVYLLEAASKDLESGKRMILWATAGGSSVTLKGFGFTQRNLPAVGHLAVPPKAGKQRIRLTVTGPGGTAKKKIVVKR